MVAQMTAAIIRFGEDIKISRDSTYLLQSLPGGSEGGLLVADQTEPSGYYLSKWILLHMGLRDR